MTAKILLGLIISCLPAASKAPFQDHLLPVRGELDHSYVRILKRKLFVTPADFGRITSLGGEKIGEWSLAIHTDEHSKTGIIATCTRAERNLGNETWELNPHRVDDSVIKIHRTDWPFPRSTAEAVFLAVRTLLGNRAERETTGRASDITLDGLRVIFSISPESASSDGLMVPESRGPRTHQMLQLAELARRDREARDSDEREAAAKKLEAQAHLMGDQ